MGNRAVIAFANDAKGDDLEPYAVYLHWNGGPESVYSFLDYLADKAPDRFPGDMSYAAARLVQIIGNYFGGTTSLGILDIKSKPGGRNWDHGDNGVYVIGPPKPGSKGRYDVLKRWRGYPGKLMTPEWIADEIETAKRHDYHKEGGEDGSIMQQIAKANDQFFNKP